jgi:hypothetical protein
VSEEVGRRADRTAVLSVPVLDPEPAEEPDQAPEPAALVAPLPPTTPVAEPEPPRSLRPPRPASRPARRGPARRSPALPLVLAGVLLLSALVGAVALLNSQDDPARSPAAAPSSAPSTEPGSPASRAGTGTGGPTPGAGAQSAAPAPAPATGPVPAPEGWQSFTAGPGWEVAVPASYRQGSFKGEPEYRDNATGRTLRVGSTKPGAGKADAVEDRQGQARDFAQRHPSYSEISIERIEFRGYEAADWEFTYRSGGTDLHVLSRVFVVEKTGYSLYFQTRASDDWPAARAEFERISASFRPA